MFTWRNVHTRRSFVRMAAVSAAAATALDPHLCMSAGPAGDPLSGWIFGALEIHHISTGRGNSTFVICPDGTTMLIDAGAKNSAPGWENDEMYRIQPRPDASRRPGEWIARYITRRMRHLPQKEIDYFVLTHLHDDHMGGIDLIGDSSVQSRLGNYLLTGVMDVNETIRIRTILDRGYPDYSYPAPLTDPHQLNYRSFIRSFLSRGGKVERFSPGSSTQLSLRHDDTDEHFNFKVQNLAVNGQVWTGIAQKSRETFPPLKTLASIDSPSENKCSVALCVSFGGFRYFSGGDMDSDTRYGQLAWADIESTVASICGHVDVAIANHHGYENACGPNWVKELRPRAIVVSAWDSAHPTIPALDNILSDQLYAGPRDIFSTALKQENVIATKRLRELKSGNGHVVIRVSPPGDTFEILIVSNHDESDAIIGRFGPYATSGVAGRAIDSS